MADDSSSLSLKVAGGFGFSPGIGSRGVAAVRGLYASGYFSDHARLLIIDSGWNR